MLEARTWSQESSQATAHAIGAVGSVLGVVAAEAFQHLVDQVRGAGQLALPHEEAREAAGELGQAPAAGRHLLEHEAEGQQPVVGHVERQHRDAPAALSREDGALGEAEVDDLALPDGAADHALAVGPGQGLDHARRRVARHHGTGPAPQPRRGREGQGVLLGERLALGRSRSRSGRRPR